MPQLKENAFTFESSALPKDTFSVVRFSGEEGLSMLYRFEIQLISEREDIDLTAVLQNPATFTIRGRFANGPALPFHGILSAFEQMHQVGPYFFYRAELRPRLWWLTLTHHNQVFLDRKIDQFLAGVLEDGGLAQGLDFAFHFQGRYAPREYVCQYGESHFDFVSRWMEREGAYYWFEQGEHSEKMIASDTYIAHGPLPGHETFVYSPPSGLDTLHADKVIKRFTLKQTPMPKNVLLRDYNYMKPSLDLEGKAQVQEQGRGEIYLYGEHFPDKAEGARLAGVRAEEYRCREKVFHALSHIPSVRPGYLFTLERHYRRDFNQQYLTLSVHHEGSQEQFLVSGLGVTDVEDPAGLFYRNTFACVPAAVQYRPTRTTPKPRIPGSLSAKIDAAGSGQYAELDEHGRYKVILPFDMSGRKDGKASAWVRMMQPYAGQGMGFHAPLHKGTEVLLSFIEADPDRPVISGAIPNAETPSPVRDENQTQVRLVSGSGNVLHMEDQEGKQRILMHSPDTGSFIRVGFKNDPDDEEDNTMEVHDPQGDCMKDNTHGIKVKSEKSLTFECGDSCTIVHGDEFSRVNGQERSIVEGNSVELVGGTTTGVVGGNAFEGVLGAAEEVNIGFKIGLALAGAFELESIVKGEVGLGWKWTFHEMKEKFHVEENKIGALRSELIGEINKLVADQNTLTGNLSELAASSQRLTGNVMRLAGTTSALNAQVTTLNGNESKIVANATRCIGKTLRVVGQKVSAIATDMQSMGMQTQLVGIKEII